nr:hypothetical protein [Tanacetum cinerariifolium]
NNLAPFDLGRRWRALLFDSFHVEGSANRIEGLCHVGLRYRVTWGVGVRGWYCSGGLEVNCKHDDKTKSEAKGKSPVESSTGYKNLSAESEDFSDNSINEVNAVGSLVFTVRRISTNSTNTFSAAGPCNAADRRYKVACSLCLLHGIYGVPMDVKSAFLCGTIKEEVYVCQPLKFEDPDHPDKRGKIDQTVFIKRQQGDILLVQIYVDDIILGSTNKDLCEAIEKLMKDKFQISSMGELTFYLGLQVKQKKDRIFISQDKYVAEILRNFGLTDGKSASTPIDTEKPLLKDPDAYSDSDYAGASLDKKSTTGGCQFLGCRLISWQYKKQTVVATSSTEAEYVAATIDEKVGIEVCAVDLSSAVRLNVTDVSLKFLLFVKKVNDVPRLQALVDRKKVIITEATIRYALRLDDAEGIDCLPNEEIFTKLARIGYEKPSTKLTFYKAFFSSQWKFLIHTILQCMSAKRTLWNEIQVCDLSSHSTKYSSPALTQKVFANMIRVGKGFSGVKKPLFEGIIVAQQVGEGAAEVNVKDVPTAGVADEGAASVADDDVPTTVEEPFIPLPTPHTPPPQPSQDIPSTTQVQPTPSPIAQPQSPQQQLQPSQDTGISIDLLKNLLETCITLTRIIWNLEQDKIAQIELKQRVKKLKRRNKFKASKLRRLKKVGTSQRIETSDDTVMDDVSKQERIIADMDADQDITLKDVAAVAKDVQDAATEEILDVQERKAESQAQIYHIDLEHADKVLSMQGVNIEPSELQKVVEVVTTAKFITEVVTTASATITVVALQFTTTAPTLTTAPSPARRKKGVVIRDPKETATPSTIIHSEAKSKDKGKGISVEEPEPLKKQAQIEHDEAFARELEAELNKTIN